MPTPIKVPQVGILREFFSYNPKTGVLKWKKVTSKSKSIGSVAGKPQKPLGYVQVGFLGKVYQAHRLIWAMHYNEEPPKYIDHINMIKSDNRIENLRAATNAENMQNSGAKKCNKTGFKGVFHIKTSGRYMANICVNNKKIYLGTFATAKEAHAAYCAAAEKLHGRFKRTG